MIEPYYDSGGITIYHGDCREVLPQLGVFDLMLTDPPYGIKRFEKGFGHSRWRGFDTAKNGLTWDKKVDVSELLQYAREWVVWGANNFSLPTTEYFLVWDKQQTVPNFASAELAYTNIKQPAQIYQYSIHQHNRDKLRLHPTQKPLGLIRWCLGFARDAQNVVDPFMGSATTLVAAKECGMQSVGIDADERYCEIAAERLRQEVLFV